MAPSGIGAVDQSDRLESGPSRPSRNQRGNQRLFPITRERFWQIVKEHATAAGLPKRKSHPHAVKHTLCAKAIKVCGIEQVRQLRRPRKWVFHGSLSPRFG
jgi:hypothetical protein